MADLMIHSVIHSETEDRKVLDRLIKAMRIPSTVLSYDIKVGDDSSGDSSLFVKLKVNEKSVASSSKRFRELRSFADEVQKVALSKGVSRWPYVELVNGIGKKR
ncbi:hypothetical protein J7431_21600 [Xanthomonas phaseoli pv. dieffenbachiae]|uniref:hypothetical protein n=1 Tax=Xanthomonas TaxID=338 RepID=UPI00111BF84A|nr:MULTISPECIES: hypothetical protein [Xanthomonas]MBO9749743.1 hypothetical protein [Xanthomonas phaseoli pv. dieffenbachiae]MBO9753883.1 hypothetical protein [Xanthomonas phaseoli pv. dieffenbachiae]MBO9889363.1 hypothetical protein [Xanthomonas sp. D-36-1]